MSSEPQTETFEPAFEEQRKADDVQPLQYPNPTETAHQEAPVAASNEPRGAEDVTALPQPGHLNNNATENTTTTGAVPETNTLANEEPVTEAKTGLNAAEPITSGMLGYKAPGLMK